MAILVSRRTPIVLALIAAALLAPAAADAAPGPASVGLHVGHLRGGKATILSRVPIKGTLAPYVAGEKVDLLFFRNGHQVGTETLDVHSGPGGKGTFKTKFRVRRNGRFAVQAVHAASDAQQGAASTRRKFSVRFPALHPGKCGRVVRGFKKALRQQGYVPSGGSCFSDKDARAVLAFRKVNNDSHNFHSGAGIVKAVFAGHGAYHLKYPKAGKHAEVSISKQVLVLAAGGKPVQTYHVSTGKSSTPTITGHFHFYLRQPGTNAEGMVDSTYFHGGYAVHGYPSVPPTYPASHGCVRVPIPDAAHIYNSIDLGESIWVY
jgi:lipoprotein-anchoring transpeptidase ErfK/SrfK